MLSLNTMPRRNSATLGWQLRLQSLSQAGSTIALIGIALAAFAGVIDLGGVLPWTQWAVSVLILLSLFCALPAAIYDPPRLHRKALAIPAIVLFGCGWAYLQQVPLTVTLVRLLSPGAADAYATLEAASVNLLPDNTISLSQFRTRHWIALGWSIATAVWIATVAVRTKQQATMLLWLFAAIGVIVTALGFYQQSLDPGFTAFGYRAPVGGYPFATYINRNNAALILNLSFASCLALLAEGMMNNNQWNTSTPSLWLRRYLPFGLLALLGCGLLVCGSRGGIVSCVAGLLAAAMYTPKQVRRQFLPLLTAAVCLGLLTAFLFAVPTPAESEPAPQPNTDRFSLRAVTSDARLEHWPDGIRAAVNYLPAGSGLGTYRFAYLPFVNSTPDAWYHHADNLWLEWLVELGIGAVVILVAFLCVQLLCLRKLRVSESPVDFSLGLASAYATMTVLCSQFFDFGLLWPSAGIISGTIFSVAVVRSSLVRGTGKVPSPMRGRSISILSICIAAVTPLAISQLSSVASSDFAKRKANTADESESNISQRQTRSVNSRDANKSIIQAERATERARRALTNDWTRGRALTPSESERVHQLTAPRSLRKQHWQSRQAAKSKNIGELVTFEASQQFKEAIEHYQEALISEPLNASAWHGLITLDFQNDNPQTEVQLRRLLELRRNAPQSLYEIGGLALESYHISIAKTSWRECSQLDPDYVVPILRDLVGHPTPSPNDVIGDNPDSLAIAAEHTLRSSDPDLSLLHRAIPALESLLPVASTRSDQLRQRRTLLMAYVEVGEESHAEKAAFNSNLDTEASLPQLLARLYEQRGNRAMALQVLRKTQKLHPGNDSVQANIRKLSKSGL